MSRTGALFPLLVLVPLAAFQFLGCQGQFPRQACLTVPHFLFFVALYFFASIALIVIMWVRFYNILLQYPATRRLVALYVSDFIWIMYEFQLNVAFYIGKYSVDSVLFCMTMILSAYGLACIVGEKQQSGM